MLNEKRTQRIMKSKFLIFLSAVAMLLLFSNCGSKTTSNDQATTEVKDTVASKEEAVPDSVSILGDQVYDIVNTAPEFPGGMKACLEFLYKNITYPAQAIESKQEGQVVIQFVVTKNGKIIDPKVVKSVSPSLDAEAIRIINLMLFSSSGIFISQNEKYGLYLYLVWHNLLKTVYEERDSLHDSSLSCFVTGFVLCH